MLGMGLPHYDKAFVYGGSMWLVNIIIFASNKDRERLIAKATKL